MTAIVTTTGNTSNDDSSFFVSHILVVDSDPATCQQIEQLLTHEGHRLTVTATGEQALQLLEDRDIDLVVTEIQLPGVSGVELIRRITKTGKEVPIVAMTGQTDTENAVEVFKAGASDYLVKPLSGAAVQESVRTLLEKNSFFTEMRQLRRQLKGRFQFGSMLSRSVEMHRVFETLRLVAPTDTTVVIEGETGTGKEMVAKTIHRYSARRAGTFVTINCGGLPETLLESELFGYERGAFTGADQSRAGKIEMAHRGTLFLDEIENISLSMQAKLLLVLQDHKVTRLGSTRQNRVDMRVVAASNVDLKQMVAQGKMRSDFYFRIHVIAIKLIPLRQRPDDIPLLVQDFLREHSLAVEKNICDISSNAMNQLLQYRWPGNIRELQNVLEKAVVLCQTQVLESFDLGTDLLPAPSQTGEGNLNTSRDLPLSQWIREQEKSYLIHKLKLSRGRVDLTAKTCGVDVRTIHRKMQLYGLDKKDFGAPGKLGSSFQNRWKIQRDN